MMKMRFALVLICLCLAPLGSSRAGEISRVAQRLFAKIDALNVEQHWPAGEHVHWETGEPDGKPERTPGKHTHCSTFVAAAVKHLGIYILRPPEHGQLLLANAQYDWLANAGVQHGWRPLRDAVDAQSDANRGLLVVATYKNHQDDKPGHIAIVRPSNKSRASILSEGPQVTQAGGTNYRSTSLRQGFAGHQRAFERDEVRYYAHVVQ
jgi:hypothetical protein